VIGDTSAMITVALEEPGFEAYLEVLLQSPVNRMSSANFLEAAIVVDRLPNTRASIRFNELINELDVIIEPVSVEQARIAREAHSRFGRGTGHPAKLNFGDCFAYALAKEIDEPLLFIGNDFIHTDIRPALP
jgi:ribonuclease VapC